MAEEKEGFLGTFEELREYANRQETRDGVEISPDDQASIDAMRADNQTSPEDNPIDGEPGHSDLEPDNWFSDSPLVEYGMPFTMKILEDEARERTENPDGVSEDRHSLNQFIIDQETAVARDFHEGRISQEEFDQFKEVSEGRVEMFQEKLEKEAEELEETVDDLDERLAVDLQDIGKEHRTEIDTINEKIESDGGPENFDVQSGVSLHLAADLNEFVWDGLETVNQAVQPHSHAIMDVVEAEYLETAQALVDARSGLSSADANEIAAAREQLDALEPVVEAEFDEAHEEIDSKQAMEAADIDKIQDAIEASQAHAELNPGISAEHAPYVIDGDYDVRKDVEDEMGVVDT